MRRARYIPQGFVEDEKGFWDLRFVVYVLGYQ